MTVEGLPDKPKTLSRAFALYTSELPESERLGAQAEISKLIRWLGYERVLDSISPQDIGAFSSDQYGGTVSKSSADQLVLLKGFLKFLKDRDLVSYKLAGHLRYRRARDMSEGATDVIREDGIYLTPEGHKHLSAELQSLKVLYGDLVEDIRKAAADGDVRENSPLEAARERQAMTDARIKEIETTLSLAIVTENVPNAARVSVGSKVTLRSMDTDDQIVYQVVEQDEIDPLSGKISTKSPVGAAIFKRRKGMEVVVVSPRGKRKYRIDSID